MIPVILVLVFFLFNGKNRRGPRNIEDPMKTLDNRFAKGEISKEEYEEQKRTINSKN